MEKSEEEIRSIPTLTRELTNALYIVSGVNQKLESERENITSAVARMMYISKEFETCSKKITEKMLNLDSMTQEIIASEMQKIAKGITEVVSSNICKVLTLRSEESVSRLEAGSEKILKTISSCEYDISQARRNINFFSRWSIIVALVSATIGGLIVGAMFRYLPSPVAKIDKSTANKIQFGEIMQMVWPHLNKGEQDVIKSLHATEGKSRKIEQLK